MFYSKIFRKYTYLYIIYIPQSASDAAYIGAQRVVAGVKTFKYMQKKLAAIIKKAILRTLKDVISSCKNLLKSNISNDQDS